MKRVLTRLSIFFAAAAAGILLSWVVGSTVVPVLLKKVAVQELTKFLGRTVTIQDVKVNPFALSITVNAFAVTEPSGGTTFSLDSLHVVLDPWRSLRQRIVSFKEIVVSGPRLNIVRNADSSFNFADLLLLKWPDPPLFRADLVRLVDGKVFFNDGALRGGFSTNLGRLTLTMPDFSTAPGHDNSLSFSTISDTGEKFSWKGFVKLQPWSSRGEIAAEDMRIAKYSRYFKNIFGATVVDGTLDAHASYELDSAPDAPRLILYDGAFAAHSLKVNEEGSTAPLFGFTDLALDNVRVDFLRQTIHAATISVTGGTAVLRRLSDNSFNIQHLIKPAGTAKVTPHGASPRWNVAVGEIRLSNFATEVSDVFAHETVAWKDLRVAGPAFQMNPPAASVAEVTLVDGTLVFTDPSTLPPVRMALTQLDVRIGAFSSANPRLESVAIHGMIDDAAKLQVFGATDPMSPGGDVTLRGLLQNVSLVPLSPYAEKYLGYGLTAGDLSVDVAFLVRHSTISAQSRIEIDRLTLGGRTESKDATKVPVRLVVFLLKDSKGAIVLNVPIERKPGDPQFELAKTLLDAVLHPFMKTVTFPFGVLGVLPESGGEELGVQEFSAGSVTLLPEETGKLDAILLGLVRWPEVMLDIEGSVDSAKDSGDLQLLADGRARTVREYLLQGGAVQPDRIFLIDNPVKDVVTRGSRAFLTLKDKYRGAQ